MNETPEQIYIDGLMIETSRKRGYGRYYFDNGDNAQDLNEYVRANLTAPDAAQLHEMEREAMIVTIEQLEKERDELRDAVRRARRNAPTCNLSCERWVSYGDRRQYDPNKPCTCGAHLSIFPAPAASTPTESCKIGEPLMHGPQPYRWCDTHNRLMMACEGAAASTEAQDEHYSCCEHESGLEGHGTFCCIHGKN